MMEEHQWSPDELQALALLGLSITPYSDPAYGWGVNPNIKLVESV